MNIQSSKFLIILLLITSYLLLTTVNVVANVAQEQAALEKELFELESQIEKITSELQTTQKERTTLERDIAVLDAKRQKVKLKIRAQTIRINKLSSSIAARNVKIENLTEKINKNKASVSELIRQINDKDSASLVEIIIGYDNFSDFFVVLNSFEEVQKGLQISLNNVKTAREQARTEKQELQNEKIEQIKFKKEQEIEKQQVENFKKQKKNILAITQGEEKKYQALLTKTKQTAAEIRSRIFRLIGNVELTFGEAVKIAEIAERATGIRAALILAVLSQESSINGIIGKNIGQCYYNTPSGNGSGTVMSNRQKPSFLAIMAELGMNANATKVSCPIKSDGAYGGAMGPAQFMPTTWWDVKTGYGYKKRIAKITGNNPPSPFVNLDAFVGTALYLKDVYNSKACKNYAEEYKNVLPKRYLQERCAAAKYYAGNNWWKHRLGYGDRVAERADKFQKDINTLNN